MSIETMVAGAPRITRPDAEQRQETPLHHAREELDQNTPWQSVLRLGRFAPRTAPSQWDQKAL